MHQSHKIKREVDHIQNSCDIWISRYKNKCQSQWPSKISSTAGKSVLKLFPFYINNLKKNGLPCLKCV